MESRAQHSRNNSRLILRVPTRTFRLSRSHHPYKRVSYINCSPEPNDDLFGQDFNRFLEAVSAIAAASPSKPRQPPTATSRTGKPTGGSRERTRERRDSA
ncbi:hypothetical protein VKT23_001525 [Stygiomarasmius scandens]|uniref:Uncharacterized protein n=1 Tax=Marasmiellus scandens TaxID=2682957 RepID=A0ABR1JZQ2_9AGAR